MTASKYLKCVPLLLITAAVVMFSTARVEADQCAAFSDRTQPDAAMKLIAPGASIAAYCEPCGDAAPMTQVVETVEVQGGDASWRLVINGAGVDLAYTYLKQKPDSDKFDNVAKLVGCETSDVSADVRIEPLAKKAETPETPGVAVGTVLSFPAGSTFSEASLGQTHGKDFLVTDEPNLKGTVSTTHTVTSTSDDYRIEKSYELEANGYYLIASGGGSVSRTKRYRIIRYFKESRQERFKLEAGATTEHPFALVGIDYGCSAYVIISENVSSDTARAGVSLMKMGAELKTAREEGSVEIRVILVGMVQRPKHKGEVIPYSLEDVNEYYKPAKELAPIRAHYRVMNEIPAADVVWQEPVREGVQYHFNLDIEVAARAADGTQYDLNDPAPGAPDLVINVDISGRKAQRFTCNKSNSISAHCSFVFSLEAAATMSVSVMDDDDWGKDDFVGTVDIQKLIGSTVEVGKPFSLTPRGQVTKATLTLTL